eukprot:101032_1
MSFVIHKRPKDDESSDIRKLKQNVIKTKTRLQKVEGLEKRMKVMNRKLDFIHTDLVNKNKEATQQEQINGVTSTIAFVGQIYDNLDGLTHEDPYIRLGTAFSLIGGAATLFGGPFGAIGGAAISLVSHIILNERMKILNEGQFSEIEQAIKEHEQFNAKIEVTRFELKNKGFMQALNDREEQIDAADEKEKDHLLSETFNTWFSNDGKAYNLGSAVIATIQENIDAHQLTKDRTQKQRMTYYIWTYCKVRASAYLTQMRVVGLLQYYKPNLKKKVDSFYTSLYEEDKKRFAFIAKVPKALMNRHAKPEIKESLGIFDSMHRTLNTGQLKLVNDYLKRASGGEFGLLQLGVFGVLSRYEMDYIRLCVAGDLQKLNASKYGQGVDVRKVEMKLAKSWGGNWYLNLWKGQRKAEFYAMPKYSQFGNVINSDEFMLVTCQDDTWYKLYQCNDGYMWACETWDTQYNDRTIWKVSKELKNNAFIFYNTKDSSKMITFWVAASMNKAFSDIWGSHLNAFVEEHNKHNPDDKMNKDDVECTIQ